MIHLDYYSNARSNTPAGTIDSYAALTALCETEEVARRIDAFRAGDADAKRQLPAVCYMGRTTTGRRRADDMEPTGLVMLDADHVPAERLQPLYQRIMSLHLSELALVHITPSGRGMRIVTRMEGADYATIDDFRRALVSEQQRLAELIGLADFGDVDECVKDLSRLSFVPKADEIRFINGDVLFHPSNITIHDQNTGGGSIREPHEHSETSGEHSDDSGAAGSAHHDAGGDCQSFGNEDFRYGDMFVRDIAAEYVAWKGAPVDGTRHNFYNQMVLDFRNICNNSPHILVDVLPMFGADRKKRLSQCESLCRRHTAAKIPTAFWVWLKDRGYYVDPKAKDTDDDTATPDDAYAEEHALVARMPPLPPVFREYTNAAPQEFKIPTLIALPPIMGSAATYLAAQLYDGTMQTTSFFSCIYAAAGSGKSFVNRFLELDVERSTAANLLHEIVQRDYVSNWRMNLWNEFANTKGANEKGKARPKVSTRLMEAITSQADMLPVMKDNQGMHMFMFAPEIDTLIKGMKSGGGGDKNDIFRVAWDNGMYGQSYRNSISFRGKVAMYLNVLVTGTPAQCARLFKDVENGLVSRCLFTDLGQQEFAKYQPWKKLSQKDLQVIDNWRRRCDAATYSQPLNFDLDTLADYPDEESFDEHVPWEYQFKGRTIVDMSSVNKKLLQWLEEQRQIAEKDADHARDAFRKRAAVNAFRVGLLCHSCWKKVTKREQKIIEDFTLWFADLALMKYLKRWRDEYNAAVIEGERLTRGRAQNFGTLFDAMPDEFTKGDLTVMCNKKIVKTPVKKIISTWKLATLVEKTPTGWKKVKK
ncbi:MAG: BT4734/BF3469 family protein, partial [Bacteroidales bacterium]|nr:BT4734/BF3469 family protein [Bacteroidales bacterium]